MCFYFYCTNNSTIGYPIQDGELTKVIDVTITTLQEVRLSVETEHFAARAFSASTQFLQLIETRRSDGSKCSASVRVLYLRVVRAAVPRTRHHGIDGRHALISVVLL